ncbi:MAG: hypothetical protein V4515_12775 [Chloroflexota bacterium]
MAEFVWMRHAESGGEQAFPAGAVEQWRLLGWSECDAPVESDPAMVEHVPLARAAVPPPIDNGIAATAADLNDDTSPEED